MSHILHFTNALLAFNAFLISLTNIWLMRIFRAVDKS